jgi:hypothetical protein
LRFEPALSVSVPVDSVPPAISIVPPFEIAFDEV